MNRPLRAAQSVLLVVLALVMIGCSAATATSEPTESAETVNTPLPTFTPQVSETTTAAETSIPAETVVTEATEVSTTNPDAVNINAPMPEVKSLTMDSPEYGMQAFMWWRPEVASRDLQAIRDAGFGWVKVGFGWRDIEGAGKGIYDWSHTDAIVEMANAEGIDLVVRIDNQPEWAGGNYPLNGPPDDYQDLADFLTALATRYEGRIRAYEVWNEPNLSREWGGNEPDPGAYIEMLGMAYDAIKAADPNAMVISAGLSPTATWNEDARPDEWYLASMYEAMNKNSDGYFDVLGAHGAGFASAPEIDPEVVANDPDLGGNAVFAFRHVEALRQIMVDYGDEDKQMALLEFGWTSDPRPDSDYYWHAVSEETKADYLVRAYEYAQENWSPWMGLMSLIYMCDPDWTEEDEQYWWAITYPSYPELSPRPAYTALAAMAK